MTTETATDTTVDRASLVAKLAEMQQGHAERIASLEEKAEPAQVRFDEAASKLEAVRTSLQAAHIAIRSAHSRNQADREVLEYELRSTAPPEIAEFGTWCRKRLDELGETSQEPLSERRRKTLAALHARQQTSALELMDGDALAERIAELRAPIEQSAIADPEPVAEVGA